MPCLQMLSVQMILFTKENKPNEMQENIKKQRKRNSKKEIIHYIPFSHHNITILNYNYQMTLNISVNNKKKILFILDFLRTE